ncbi:hypothetical protein MTO96_001350 [Rhipicephalus appendiculatus]
MERLSAASTVALWTRRSAGALLQLLAHLPFSSCHVSSAAIEADCGPHKTQMTSEKARETGVLFFRTSREDDANRRRGRLARCVERGTRRMKEECAPYRPGARAHRARQAPQTDMHWCSRRSEKSRNAPVKPLPAVDGRGGHDPRMRPANRRGRLGRIGLRGGALRAGHSKPRLASQRCQHPAEIEARTWGAVVRTGCGLRPVP